MVCRGARFFRAAGLRSAMPKEPHDGMQHGVQRVPLDCNPVPCLCHLVPPGALYLPENVRICKEWGGVCRVVRIIDRALIRMRCGARAHAPQASADRAR
jgi:hypothetical protein